MEESSFSCGKCGAKFKHKRNVAKHANREQCGKKRGRKPAKVVRKSSRKGANEVENETIPVSRFRVRQYITCLCMVSCSLACICQ
jgi:uncharacterized C2H2 Zn-finger protein